MAIWVICDRLTKFVHFLALPTKYSAQDLAARFSVEICHLHGIPKSIVSDRDPLFLNGQSEVTNRSLEAYLRCFTNDHPRLWYKFLHLAEFWHNSTFHSEIRMTPFQALYGRPPPAIPDYVPGSSAIDSLDTTLQQRQEVLRTLRENLKPHRQNMQDQTNKHRKDVNFAVGDWVLLRLQPYRQHFVSQRSSQKLSKSASLATLAAMSATCDAPSPWPLDLQRTTIESSPPSDRASCPAHAAAFTRLEQLFAVSHAQSKRPLGKLLEPLDHHASPASRSQLFPKSTICVLHSSSNQQPHDFPLNQSESFPPNRSHVLPSELKDLEDKVSTGPESNVSGPIRPNRKV
ncbi:Ribonuclease H-like superfamily [Sesbania bispinosa]|nr:Ribonuclease H-like superfamily [Sesbania bispinosa]